MFYTTDADVSHYYVKKKKLPKPESLIVGGGGTKRAAQQQMDLHTRRSQRPGMLVKLRLLG